MIRVDSFRQFQLAMASWHFSLLKGYQIQYLIKSTRFNLRVRKNGAEVWWPISPYKFWSEDLLQCIYENYGKKWATLFKSHLSSCSCSDFIKLCFKAVKIDFRQLQPTKTNSNKSLFSNFKHQDREKRYDDLICLKRAWFKLSDEWSFAILAQIL